MRILVLSDSHSNRNNVRKAVELMRDTASMIIHLGDGERDMNFADGMLDKFEIVQVRGNCDIGSILPEMKIIQVRDKIFLCTHGHIERVKYGDFLLKEAAEKYGADVILYGHTHKPVTKFEDSKFYFNPGSLREGKFGYIDVVNSQINCVHLDLYDFR